MATTKKTATKSTVELLRDGKAIDAAVKRAVAKVTGKRKKRKGT